MNQYTVKVDEQRECKMPYLVVSSDGSLLCACATPGTAESICTVANEKQGQVQKREKEPTPGVSVEEVWVRVFVALARFSDVPRGTAEEWADHAAEAFRKRFRV